MCLCIVWNHSPSPLTILFARSFCWIFVSIYVSLLHFLCSRSFHSFILFESFQLYVLTVPCSSCCSAQDRWLCAFTSVECGFVLFIRYRVFVILVVFFFFFSVLYSTLFDSLIFLLRFAGQRRFHWVRTKEKERFQRNRRKEIREKNPLLALSDVLYVNRNRSMQLTGAELKHITRANSNPTELKRGLNGCAHVWQK